MNRKANALLFVAAASNNHKNGQKLVHRTGSGSSVLNEWPFHAETSPLSMSIMNALNSSINSSVSVCFARTAWSSLFLEAIVFAFNLSIDFCNSK